MFAGRFDLAWAEQLADDEAATGLELVQPREGQAEQVKALYGNAQAIFHDRYSGSLEPEFMAICEELNEAKDHWFGRESETKSIVHGDFRLDNMLFDIKGGAEDIAVLDWQTVAVGNGLTDIGYFLGTGIGGIETLALIAEAQALDARVVSSAQKEFSTICKLPEDEFFADSFTSEADLAKSS